MADKTIEDQQKEERRRRPLLSRNRPVEVEEDEEEQDDEDDDRSVTVGKGRATPSRRRLDEPEETGNIVTRSTGGLREYFAGVRSELQKVVWPTREETTRLTLIVLVTLLVSSLILGAISLTFTEVFKSGLSSPIILLGLMVIGIVAGWFILRNASTSGSSY